jgi:hypothetical protein
MKINLVEFADLIDKELVINYYPNQNGRYTAQFDSCEVKEDCMLAGTYGNGHSPLEAMNDYAKQISNTKIIFHAMNEKYRQEYLVPQLGVIGTWGD